MRKLLVLMAIATLALPPVGCARCRGLFHRGAPCGTTVAPAMLSAPLAIRRPLAAPLTAPAAASPGYCCCDSAPVCSSCNSCECNPCNECGSCCGDQGGWTTSGYPGGNCAECGSGGSVPTYEIDATPTTITTPGAGSDYRESGTDSSP